MDVNLGLLSKNVLYLYVLLLSHIKVRFMCHAALLLLYFCVLKLLIYCIICNN